jgi:hypothetical protein
MSKKFALLAMLAFCLILVSCGGEKAKLTGVWESEKSSIELFKDGTANLDGESATWTVENNRIMFSIMGKARSMDYKLSGKTLTLSYDGETYIFTKK